MRYNQWKQRGHRFAWLWSAFVAVYALRIWRAVRLHLFNVVWCGLWLAVLGLCLLWWFV